MDGGGVMRSTSVVMAEVSELTTPRYLVYRRQTSIEELGIPMNLLGFLQPSLGFTRFLLLESWQEFRRTHSSPMSQPPKTTREKKCLYTC